MRNVLAITLTVILAVSAVASADTFRFDGNPGTKTDYITGNHLAIAGDGAYNYYYAVVNGDGSLSRYDRDTKSADLTNASAHSYIDLASMGRLNNGFQTKSGWADMYWALYEHGVDEVNINGNTVNNRYENTGVTYTKVAGDLYTGFAYLARADGGIDVVDRNNSTRDIEKGVSGYTFIDLSEYGNWNLNIYGLTDTGLYRIVHDSGNDTIAVNGSALATFTSGTYISVAGSSAWNDRAILARADGGLDYYVGGSISTYYDSDYVFTDVETFGGFNSSSTPYEYDHNYFAVPEPTTLGLLALGGLAMLKRRKR